jgi:hypothetical protein
VAEALGHRVERRQFGDEVRGGQVDADLTGK